MNYISILLILLSFIGIYLKFHDYQSVENELSIEKTENHAIFKRGIKTGNGKKKTKKTTIKPIMTPTTNKNSEKHIIKSLITQARSMSSFRMQSDNSEKAHAVETSHIRDDFDLNEKRKSNGESFISQFRNDAFVRVVLENRPITKSNGDVHQLTKKQQADALLRRMTLLTGKKPSVEQQQEVFNLLNKE